MTKRTAMLEQETVAERSARLKREQRELAMARAQIDAGDGMAEEAVQPWLDSLGTDHVLPKPKATKKAPR